MGRNGKFKKYELFVLCFCASIWLKEFEKEIPEIIEHLLNKEKYSRSTPVLFVELSWIDYIRYLFQNYNIKNSVKNSSYYIPRTSYYKVRKKLIINGYLTEHDYLEYHITLKGILEIFKHTKI